MRGGTISVIGRDSATSRLYRRLTGTTYGPQMPPTGALNPSQIDVIKRWIDSGAEWPDLFSGDAPPRPTPPLMRAVLAGDLPAVRQLLDEGADPNAANDAGATALMWAVDDVAQTRLLIDHGANVNARSDDGRTPLIIAAGLHGAGDVVKLLLDHGANPSATAPRFGGTTHPLMEAAFAGEASAMRRLLDAGAEVKRDGFVTLAFTLHSECRACFDLIAPLVDGQNLSLAPLVLIPPADDGQRLKPLIDRGADAKVKDGLGRTALMRAAASEAVRPDVIQLLISRGADVNATSPSGETALDFAVRHGRTAVVEVLLKAGAKAGSNAGALAEASPEAPALESGPAERASSPRGAVERSLPLLQQTDETFLRKTGCVSCHHNSLTAMAVSLARSHGVRVDEQVAQDQVDAIGRYLEGWRERALQGIGIAGDTDTISYILLGLSAEAAPPTEATAAMARYVLRQQMPDGHWSIKAHRPPIESNDIQVTATAMRALQVYAPATARKACEAAIHRAAIWLEAATPSTTEERAFQLLGLQWSRAPKTAIQKAAHALLAKQRADGGWSQLPTLTSDAYATGEALVALEEGAGVASTDAAYRRGVDFLLRTQLVDGSWHVQSRAIAIQPYFDSGFPHGRDQFISAAATNWATMALAAAVRP